MGQILVVDDDVELCELLEDYLRPEGFEVESVNKSQEGLEKALAGHYTLVVLDVMMPGMSGFEVLRQLRAKSRVPVLMLTARGEDIDRIVGLEMGADDYLPKPFNPRELVARIRAIQRRMAGPEPQPPKTETVHPAPSLSIGDLVLDPATRGAWVEGRAVELTSAEFGLLELLVRTAGKVQTREELVRAVLGRRMSTFDRSLDVHVSSLRRKLGSHGDGSERIRTVRGIGYVYTFAMSR